MSDNNKVPYLPEQEQQTEQSAADAATKIFRVIVDDCCKDKITCFQRLINILMCKKV